MPKQALADTAAPLGIALTDQLVILVRNDAGASLTFDAGHCAQFTIRGTGTYKHQGTGSVWSRITDIVDAEAQRYCPVVLGWDASIPNGDEGRAVVMGNGLSCLVREATVIGPSSSDWGNAVAPCEGDATETGAIRDAVAASFHRVVGYSYTQATAGNTAQILFDGWNGFAGLQD